MHPHPLSAYAPGLINCLFSSGEREEGNDLHLGAFNLLNRVGQGHTLHVAAI